MPTISSSLHNRTQGQFPISIATSLALEGLFGIHEEHPVADGKPRPWVDYDYLHINVRTLIRNCYQAMPSQSAQLVSANEYAKVVAEEITIIESILVDNITNENFEHGYYLPSYELLAKAFPRAVLKGVSTDKQKHYTQIEDKVVTLLSSSHELKTVNCEKVALRTTFGIGRGIMFTHYPVDLLIAKHKRFSVLESHTGFIKQKYEMTNKIKTSGHKNLPFDIMTIQMFGDTANMFKPADLKVRRTMYALAQKYKWNNTTTEERIKANVKHSEPYIYEYIADLYKAPKV